MNFQTFREAFFQQICFTSNQVSAWYPGFDKNNLGRWVGKGYIVKLRNGHYIFSEHLDTENINLFIANRIYRPSYVSLHTTLAFHGLIPESITQVTSVSTLKTAHFHNGVFSYKTVKPHMFFGYTALPYNRNKSILMATPEKAILDLLYLYPFYNSREELQQLRLDEVMLDETFDKELYFTFLERIKSRAVEKRAKLLLQVYNIQ